MKMMMMMMVMMTVIMDRIWWHTSFSETTGPITWEQGVRGGGEGQGQGRGGGGVAYP